MTTCYNSLSMRMILEGLQIHVGMCDKHILYIPNAPAFDNRRDQDAWLNRLRHHVSYRLADVRSPPDLGGYGLLHVRKELVDDVSQVPPETNGTHHFAVVLHEPSSSSTSTELRGAFEAYLQPHHYLVVFIPDFQKLGQWQTRDVVDDACRKFFYVVIFLLVWSVLMSFPVMK